MVARVFGFKSGRQRGFSRINVMVTATFAGSVDVVGKTIWPSALPETAKMWGEGNRLRSRIDAHGFGAIRQKIRTPIIASRRHESGRVWPRSRPQRVALTATASF